MEEKNQITAQDIRASVKSLYSYSGGTYNQPYTMYVHPATLEDLKGINELNALEKERQELEIDKGLWDE